MSSSNNDMGEPSCDMMVQNLDRCHDQESHSFSFLL